MKRDGCAGSDCEIYIKQNTVYFKESRCAQCRHKRTDRCLKSDDEKIEIKN